MKRHITPLAIIITALLGFATPLPAAALRNASDTATTTNSSDLMPTDQTTIAAQQARLKAIQTKGDAEISRRLKTLGTLAGKISGATIITSDDKAALTDEIKTETNGLLSLKARLDGDTTLYQAKTDAKAIFDDYRVYALVMPKVVLIRTADDQQILEDRLSKLADKLQTRLTSAQADGKNVAGLQTKLDDMKKQIGSAQTTSQTVEKVLLSLQPSDYNSDHKILGGFRDQLKTAHLNIVTAYQDAQAIITGLKKP